MSDTLAELQEALEAARGNRDNIVRYNTDPYNGTVDSPIESNEAEIQGLEILIAQAENEYGGGEEESEQGSYDDEQEEEVGPQASSDDIGKSAGGGLGGPRNFFGGNFDVYSTLEKVEFQKGAGDGSLRGNVAYIRMWKRGSTAQATSASEAPGGESAPGEVSPASDEQQILQDDLEAAIGNRDNVANNYDPRIGEYDYNPYGDDVDNPIEIAEANVQIADNRIAQAKQRSVGTQTPTSSTPTQPSSTNVASPPSTQPSRGASGPALGPVKSANPNGSMGSLAKVGSALIGLPATSPAYSGNAVKGPGGSAAGQSGGVMWQFLFNPSEMELEAGPEFKNAETWGVSDKANSGQPLHWSNNKNAQLKFNSVILNGYVFGRKVEELEQGLIALFMAREGDGQHGPHVLEFVWGKRVFGPCVIKGVNVKEKMWDEGHVVNAEVSFTLEQVPEWTINDGFVDVARPGKLGIEGDVNAPAASATTPTTTPPASAGSKNPPPGGGAGQPDQKQQSQAGLTSSELYKKCQRAGVYAEQFWKIESDGRLKYRDGTINARTSYSTLYPQAVNELGSSFTGLIKEPLTNPTLLYKSTELAIDAEDKKAAFILGGGLKDYSKAGNFVKKAAGSARITAKTFSDSARCKTERDRVTKVTQQQKQQATCNSKRLGSSCAKAGVGEGQTVNTCSGITLVCARGYLKDPNSVKI